MGIQRGPVVHIMEATTSVDCSSAREAKFRPTLRSLVECMVPACCGFQTSSSSSSSSSSNSSFSDTDSPRLSAKSKHSANKATKVTGTFFGHRKGRVKFCLQQNTNTSPLLLLEFSVPTSYLAKEMQHGMLRITLVEIDRGKMGGSEIVQGRTLNKSCLGVPLWCMYCNGRKVGFAMKKEMMSESDKNVLKLMHSVSVGAGVLPNYNCNNSTTSDVMMYLRASFERIIGSPNSQSFHMMNPDGSSGQELSIFLLRSSS